MTPRIDKRAPMSWSPHGRRWLFSTLVLDFLILFLAWPALRVWTSASAVGVAPMVCAPIGPLLAERTRFTAGFGEPRNLRLHAGVDYSTNRATGLPVLAPAGGWISRIAADYTGYGLQLILTDSLGRRHLFAHLRGFRSDLQAELERAMEEIGHFSQLLQPDPGVFPVRAGEVIAFSGDTGNGPPHLHYELRSASEDRCFNPLRFGLQLDDGLPPVIERLALVPLAQGSLVMGGLMPCRVTPIASGVNHYSAPDTLECAGPVGLALHAVDRMPGTGSRLPPWRVAVVESGDTLFRLTLDSFPLACNSQSGRMFDRWLQQETGRPFLRLWGDGELGIWDGGPGALRGRLLPQPDRSLRRLLVLVWDAAENLATLDLILRQVAAPAPLTAFTRPVAEGRSRPGSKEEPKWSRLALPDGLHLRLAPLPPEAAGVIPRLVAGRDSLAAWGQFRDKGWEWVLPCGLESQVAAGGGELRVSGLKGLPPLSMLGPRLEPERETIWRDSSGNPVLVMYADPACVAESSPLYLRRWKDPQGVFSLGPPELQLESNLLLELDLSFLPEVARGRTLLFQANSKGQPVAMVGGVREGHRLKVLLGKTGTYVLHADTRGPKVTLRKAPATKKRKRRGRAPATAYPARPTLVWEIGGDPSGIVNVILLESGRRRFPHYEPDTHLVHFTPPTAWDAGDRTLELTVSDGSGNQTVLQSTIRIMSAGP